MKRRTTLVLALVILAILVPTVVFSVLPLSKSGDTAQVVSSSIRPRSTSSTHVLFSWSGQLKCNYNGERGISAAMELLDSNGNVLNRSVVVKNVEGADQRTVEGTGMVPIALWEQVETSRLNVEVVEPLAPPSPHRRGLGLPALIATSVLAAITLGILHHLGILRPEADFGGGGVDFGDGGGGD